MNLVRNQVDHLRIPSRFFCMQPGHPSMCAQHLGHAEAVAGATVVRNADCASRVWSSARKNKLQITIFVK